MRTKNPEYFKMIEEFINDYMEKNGVSLLTSLIKNLPSIISQIVSSIPQIITGIVNALNQGMSKITSVGSDLIRGLWNGISNMTSWVISKIQGFGSSVLNALKKFFGIASPSKEMAWVGEMLTEGLGVGIDDHKETAVQSAKDMGSEISGVMHNIAEDMETALPTEFHTDGLAHAIEESGNAAVAAAEAMTAGVAATMSKLEHDMDAAVPLMVHYEEPKIPDAPDGERTVVAKYTDDPKSVPQELEDQTVHIAYAVDATADAVSKGITTAMEGISAALDQTITVQLQAELDTAAMEKQLREAKASGKDMTMELAQATAGEADSEQQTISIMFDIAGVLDSLARLRSIAVSAIHAMRDELTLAMQSLAERATAMIPTKVDVDANIRGAVGAIAPAMPTPQSSGMSLTLNISTFNNYSAEDIQQLTNEIMVTAGQFAKRKGVVYA